MPKKKNTDLASFQKWLLESYGVSPRTATVYASYVRKLLTKLEIVNTKQLDLLLAQEWTAQSRDMFYVGWNRFAEYMKKVEKKEIAKPSLRSGRRESRKQYKIPACVFDDVLNFTKIAHIKLSVVPLLKWEHFRRIPNSTWEMADPLEAGLFYRVPIEPVVNLFDWGANGDPIPKSPLIPVKPLSLEPLPINPLRRLIREHRRVRSQS